MLWPGENEAGRTTAHESTLPAKADSAKKQKDIQLPAPEAETTENLVAENKSSAKAKKSTTTSVKKENPEKVEEKTENTIGQQQDCSRRRT